MKFKIGECRISINFYFFAGLTIFALWDKGGMITASVIAAVLHECGHLAVMLGNKEQIPSCVKLTPFGMKIDNRPTAIYAKGRVWVILAGSLTNIVTASISFAVLPRFAAVNLIMAVTNLLPIDSLDGGELLRNILSRIISERNAEYVSMVISFAVLCFTFFMGLRVFIYTGYNYSLLFMSVWMLVSLVSRIIRHKN